MCRHSRAVLGHSEKMCGCSRLTVSNDNMQEYKSLAKRNLAGGADGGERMGVETLFVMKLQAVGSRDIVSLYTPYGMDNTNGLTQPYKALTFWRRIFFFQILAPSVFKM